MRNIKSTLRFARNSALLFVAASGMSYLSSCSETDINPDNGGNNGDDNVLVEKLKVTAGTNPGLAKTYPNSHQIGTRAAFDVPEHPGMPTSIPTEFDFTLDETFAGNEEALIVNVPSTALESDYPSDSIKNVTVFVPQVEFNEERGNNYKCLPASFNVRLVHQWASGENGYWQKVVNVSHIKYYINSDITIGGVGPDGDQEIHILNGAKVKSNDEFAPKNKVYLYKGGKLLRSKSNGDDNEIYLSCTVISEEDIVTVGTITIDSGKVYTYGKIQGNVVETINNAELYAGCAVKADTQIYLTGNAQICAGYMSAPTIKLDSSAHILLRDGAYVNATKMLDLRNCGNVRVAAEEGEYAMIEADVLNVNDKDLTGTFDNIGIKYNSQEGTQDMGADETYVHLKWNESTQVYWVNEPQEGGESKIVVFDYALADGDECAPKKVVNPNEVPDVDPIPGTTPDPAPDPTPVPTLENIGSVAPSGDHTHPISATCIFANGKDAYLSWHTQGANFHGCIEYLTVDNGKVTLNAYLETSKDNADYGAIDFNHVIFDNGKIFVAGDHPKKGGILGWIHCNDGKFVTGEAELNLKELYNGEGGSGNCIIRNGSYYQVASVKGFETYNVNDFNVGATSNRAVARLAAYDFDPEGESATGRQTGKHIATDGQKVVMLTLINRDNSSNTAKASIKVYNASDIEYKNVVASYVVEDAVLSPVDGKDVIAIEGDDIWVCLGKGGVQHLKLAGSNISKVASFSLADLTSDQRTKWSVTPKQVAASCANGLAVGNDGYVYVAHGGAGLVVLKKGDLSFVTRSRHNGGASANYVKLHEDGYIYVAYGKSNVQVFAWKK